MIFVYPAAISDGVDQRYLHGLIKTMELYYLHHIAEAVASGSIRFYITQSRLTGKFSDVKMEAINWDYESLGSPDTLMERSDLLLQEECKRVLTEAVDDNEYVVAARKKIEYLENLIIDVQKESNRLEKEYKAARDAASAVKYNDSEKQQLEQAARDRFELFKLSKQRLNGLQEDLAKARIDLDKAISGAKKDENQEERNAKEKDRLDYEKDKEKARETGGVTRMELDKGTTDLRPSAIVVEATVIAYEKGLLTLPGMGTARETKRSMPISVKIVPIKIKNVKNIYDTLTDDMYANEFSTFYKSSVRALTSVIFNVFNPIVRVFLNTFTKPQDFGLWKDILLKKKGLVNASSIGSGPRFPSHQKYAAAIIVFSINDIIKKDMNFLGDASKVAKLHKMGWNSFAIMDDPDQTLMFCSYFENGMCSKIPYSYLFFSLKASDLFKELDSLSKFTGRVIGNFKARPSSIREGLKFSAKLREQNNKAFNRYLEIANKHGSK